MTGIDYRGLNELLSSLIESSLEGLKYAVEPRKVRGMIEAKDLLKATNRTRLTQKMIEQYIAYIDGLGIDADYNKEAKAIFLEIHDIHEVVLNPDQMKIKNKNIALYNEAHGDL